MNNVSVKAITERRSKRSEFTPYARTCLIFEEILMNNVFEKCSKIDALGMVFNVLGMLLIAHIIRNYLYIYLSILYNYTIYYTIYNTIHKAHNNAAFITLRKKINFIFIIYNITNFIPIFCRIEVEPPSKHCGCSVFYASKKHLSVDIRSQILTNNKGEITC